MAITQTAPAGTYRRPEQWPSTDLIDCDVRIQPATFTALFPYLSEHWRAYITESGMAAPTSNLFPPHPSTFVPGSTPTGGPPGSDLTTLQDQLLDPWRTTRAIINCSYAVDVLHNPDLAAALATALNQWQLTEWLQRDQRLRGSAVLPVQSPDLAAAEIERIAEHEAFIQVVLPARAREPLGRRGWWPIYRAAHEHGLVVAVQSGGLPGLPPTPVGWPSTFLEDYVGLIEAFQAQLVSLVCEGVFEEFPDLRVAFLDSGFSWLPSLLWRLDKNWKGLRREVPWVRSYPSEIVAEHFALSVQPVDAPQQHQQLLEVIDQLPAEHLLLFASEYPYAPFTDPAASVPRGLSEESLTGLLGGNAARFYRLDRRTP
ncbi:amidohydrolase family protein [Microlunatus soli]|uniref:Amidohydrolase-related domain-containing protein n=1 Tax=Microlunatus soli TaxID=630515 RepID=A0A1H1QKM4_9ACTN|nr:amidohydrolase family protein [Microlunatus soli]SDS24010.1 hypothetical protein SAMN04489812_1305 [Microlunatus soli]